MEPGLAQGVLTGTPFRAWSLRPLGNSILWKEWERSPRPPMRVTQHSGWGLRDRIQGSPGGLFSWSSTHSLMDRAVRRMQLELGESIDVLLGQGAGREPE